MSSTIKQAIDSLKDRIANAYAAVANKGGTLPTTQDSANLVSAIESIPNTITDLVATENNKEYLPANYGVYGFGKVKTEIHKVLISERILVRNSMLVDGYWAAEMIDTSACKDLNNFFYNAPEITKCDVSNWDTSQVTDMTYVFATCNRLEEIDVSNWDTSKVIRCNDLFNRCSALKELNTSKWTLKPNTIANIFFNCRSLEVVDVSRFDVSNVTTLERTFYRCENLKVIDVSKWNVSNVTNLSNTFAGCSLVSYIDVSGWDVSKVTNMDSIFYSCKMLKTLDLTNWDVSNVAIITFAFGLCNVLSSLIGNRSIDEVLANNITALNGLKVSSHFSFRTTSIDRASIRAVINGLADMTGQTAQRMELGATLIAKLTEEDIAIATNKNWTIV